MKILHGKGVSGGIAFGTVRFSGRDEVSVKRKTISNPALELSRIKEAKVVAAGQLTKLYDKALREVGEANAQIFDIHRMMLSDADYLESIENYVQSQHVNAEYAVAMTADNFSEMFSAMDDDYLRARAADIRDISNRLIRCLTHRDDRSVTDGDALIICAQDLAPSETVQLDKSRVAAFCTTQGAASSHTAILARTMGIPAVISLGNALSKADDGKKAIVDGGSGVVYVEPNAETDHTMRRRQADELHRKALLEQLKGKDNVTLDGRRMDIYANIGGLSDLGAVLTNDAGGIGLFRSEFLYLESNDSPTEETQFQCYKKVLERMAGKRVIIRTMDIGADKRADYFHLDREENPALGYRAIRICLTRPELFRTQLRALYRASAYGRLGILLPMIASPDEVTDTKRLISEVQAQLTADGIPFSEQIELGVMIETPAAAVISDLLAPMVDFFSVGTNDLTQYTLAADRQNPRLERFCNPHHPAILRLISLAAENAHRHHKWIGICGELAGDLSLTEVFLAMEIDELSVSPSQVLPLREKIRNARYADAQESWDSSESAWKVRSPFS